LAQHLRTLQISTFGSDGQDGIALGIRSFPVHKLVMICFDSDKNKAEEFSKRIRGVLGLPTRDMFLVYIPHNQLLQLE
jgi:hypothetical protein